METEPCLSPAEKLVTCTLMCPPEHSQFFRIQLQIAKDVIAQGAGDEAKVEALWSDVSDILWSVSSAIEPFSAARERWEKDGRRHLWIRSEVRQALENGDRSSHYYEASGPEIEMAAATYLKVGWLRNPDVDYAIVDALVTRELCAFGQAVMASPMAFGLVDNIIAGMAREKAEGNLEKLVWEAYKIRAQGFLWIYVAPVAALTAIGFAIESPWPFVLATLWAAFYAIRWVYRVLIAKVRQFSGRKTPFEQQLDLWRKMEHVHRLLSGEVLSPSLVKAEIDKTREAGAVWSQTIDVILARRVRENHDEWVLTA